MLSDIEFDLTMAAFKKWVIEEPFSTKDFERIMDVIDKKPMNFDIPDQAKLAALQVRFRSLLHERFMPREG